MTYQSIKFIFSLLQLVLLSSVVHSQTIESIEYQGTRAFTQNDYLNWGGVPAGTAHFDYLVDTLKIKIANSLTEHGYFNFYFESTESSFFSDSQKVKLKFIIDEGEPTYINEIVVNGIPPEDSLDIIHVFSFLEGSIFIKSELEENISTVLDFYEENGYPFTRVRIESIYFLDDSVSEKHLANINLTLNRGQLSTINKIEISGNTKTKDYVLIRNIRLDKNELYSQKRIEEIPKQLNRLRFFEPVDVPGFYFNSNDEGILQIKIEEKETNNFDGIVGYVPSRTDDEKGFFTGFVNVSLRNMFGTGRAAAVRWQQEDRHSQELELRYLEPWIFGFPFNIGLGLHQRKQDTTYVQRKFNGSLEFLATEEITASLLIATESTIPSESDSSRFTVFNSTSFSTGLNLKIDTRDDFYAPTEGVIFLNTYKFSTKKISGPEQFITPTTNTKINLQRLEVDFSFFYEFFRRQVAALGLHAREMRGSFFEISDLYQLGGTNTLRGYRENQFRGNRIFWSNLEYRYLLSKRSFAFLFFDTGYYLRNEDKERSIIRTSDFKIGFGLGLSIETALGVMGVSYALGKGDSFSDGKIHFGLLNEF